MNFGLLDNKCSMIDLSKYEIVSFDLFDTLFLRKIKSPIDIFKVVEHISRERNFSIYRIKAEKIAKKNKEETTLDEIYSCLNNILQKNTSYLKNLELKIEEDFIFVNPKIFSMYKKAKEFKKKIIFVSDMYLPYDFLSYLLNKYNIKYNKLYLSSSLKITKASGKLFKYILNDMHTSPQKIIHIGDNYAVDILMAKKFGINNFFYENHLDFCKRNNLIEKNDNLVLNIIDGLEIHKKILLDIENDFWYIIGYNVAGILYFGFVLWLYDQVEKLNINKLLFLSRDGFIIRKIFNKLLQKKSQKEVKTYYVFASRAGYLNSEKNIIKDYFKKFTNNNKIYIVDIGWKGTIQNILNNILPYEIYGFYLGVIDDRKIKNKNSIGYLFTNSIPKNIFNAIQESFEVVELLFSAPHGTLVKLIEKDGKVAPIFRKDITGIKKQDMFQLEKGIKDFFEDFYPLYEKYNLKITNEVAISKLKRLLTNPTILEASKIGDIFHSQDIDKYLPLPIAKPKYTKQYYNKNPHILKQHIETSFWRIGFLKRLDEKDNILSFEQMEKKLVERIKEVSCISIFGTAQSGKKTYELLQYYKIEDKLKFFIDDFKNGYFLNYPIITTKDFLSRNNKNCIVIYGRYQKINPALEKNKNIEQYRIYSVV